jgi:hypothetical protein
LIEELTGAPERAQRFMTRLATDMGMQRRLQAVLKPDEFRRLAGLADEYGVRLAQKEGLEIGASVLAPGTTTNFQTVARQANNHNGAGRAVEVGARTRVHDLARESPGHAQGVLHGLHRSVGLQERLAAALSGGETARLQRVGRTGYRAMENMETAYPFMTEARQRAQQTSAQIQDLIGLGVVAFGKTSGAMKANMLTSLVQWMRISKKGATRMAEMLTDPAQAHKAIRQLRRRGIDEERILGLYRDAAVAAGLTVPELTR